MEPQATEFDTPAILSLKQAVYLQAPVEWTFEDGETITSLPIYALSQVETPLLDLVESLEPRLNLELGDLTLIIAEAYRQWGGLSLETLFPEVMKVVAKYPEAFKDVSLRDLRDFEHRLDRLESEMKAENQRQQHLLETIETNQRDLAEIKPLEAQAPTVDSVLMLYYPTFQGEDDGLALFDAAQPSLEVPHIHYNDSTGHPRVWIYQRPEDGVRYDYNDIILSHPGQPETLYLTVCHEEKLENLTKDSFSRCVLSLEEGTLLIPIPAGDTPTLERIKGRLLKALPGLELDAGEESRIRGSFLIEAFDLCEMSLYLMVLSDPLMRAYLYVDEVAETRAERVRMNLHFNALPNETHPSAVVTFDPEVVGDGSSLRVTVIRADSRPVLDIFIRYFVRLLGLYRDRKVEVEAGIQRFLPGACPIITLEAEPELEEETETVTRTIRTDRPTREIETPKNKNLQRLAPDIFVKGYARKCLCPHQPIIVKADEVAEWEAKTFQTQGRTFPRQVLAFPPPRGEEPARLHLVCPLDTAPYPTLKENKLSNAAKFPYIPCCGESDHLTKWNPASYYEALEHPQALGAVREPGKELYQMATAKFQRPDHTAHLPRGLVEFLRSGLPVESDFVRLGVPKTPNALIHCVLRAKEYPEYIDLKSYEEKETLAQGVREMLVTNLNLEVYRQELYDLSETTIAGRLANPQVFLDPYLYYRGLEELLEVNIFVFNLAEPLHPLPGIESPEGPSLEIPRSSLVHLRTFREDRPTVLIVKHCGSEGNIPHCELIVARGTPPSDDTEDEEASDCEDCYLGVKTTGAFEAEMGQLLFETLEETASHYTWEGLEGRKRPYSQLNWPKILGTPLAQGVDANGKTRFLQFEFEGSKLTLGIPPTQPLNLPSITDVPSVSEAKVRRIFGQPSKIGPRGLWFSLLDYPNGLYVPAIITSKAETDEVPAGPWTHQGFDVRNLAAVREVRREASLLRQLVIWLWSLGDGTRTSRPDFETWWVQWVRLDPQNQGGKPQDIKRIYRLPKVETTAEGLPLLSQIWPAYFQPDHLRLGPKLYERLRGNLQREAVETEGLTYAELPIASYLEGLYENEADFEAKPGALVFTHLEHLQEWMQQETRRSAQVGPDFIPIRTILTIDLAKLTEPYLYEDNLTGKLYLIQNVRGGEFSRATSVLTIWYGAESNPGYEADETIINETIIKTSDQLQPLQPHIIYGISNEETLVPLKRQATEADEARFKWMTEALTFLATQPADVEAYFAKASNPEGFVLDGDPFAAVKAQGVIWYQYLNYGAELYAAMLPLR